MHSNKRTGTRNYALLIAFGLFLGNSAVALADHTASLRGFGKVSHEVQQLRVSVGVHAKCFKSPLSAYEAADRMVAQVIKILQPRILSGSPRDKVIHEGISTSPYFAYRPGTSQQICPDTYQAEGTVTLHTSAIQNFGRIFAEIQQSVLVLAPITMEEGKEAVALTLPAPVKTVYPETSSALMLQAVQKAKSNAIQKFEAACPGTPYEVVSVSDPVLHETQYYKMPQAAAPMMGEPSPIMFEQLQMTYSLDVKLAYVGSCLKLELLNL